MGGRKLPAEAVPTPGPWLVRGETEAGAAPEDIMLGIEPARDDRPGGFPYLICRDAAFAPEECPLHLAIGIQRFADARLMAAAPDLAAALLNLLIVREIGSADLSHQTQEVIATNWDLLVRVTPHLEIR